MMRIEPGGAAPAARPLKVLMIAPTSFFGDYGGHIRILEETLVLQNLGHSVTIVTYYKGRDLAGLDIRRTPPLPYHAEYEVGSSRHKLAFDAYLAIKALRVARRVRPDIIHGHMHEGALIGGALARLLGVPLVFDFQGSLTGEMVDHGFLRRDGYIYRLVWWLETMICRLPAAILTSSVRVRTLLTDDFAVPPARIVPLPDCVDTTRFDPGRYDEEAQAALRRRWGIPADRPVVVYLGLLTAYQGTDLLIRAAARLKKDGVDAHFLIMGFPNVDRYQQMAAELDVADRVTLTGKVPYDRAPLYLSLGAIAVSPKMSATEGSGKVLNYMAMAQPVIASDNPVHGEYLAEWGQYVPQGDEVALAEAIGELLDRPERGRELGNGLRRRAEAHYSWTSAGARIAALYAALIAGELPP